MKVAATLNLEQATRRTWDVAVVGAGPAGALAALELARRGRSVLLIDRASFPRWKVCGCCLNNRAVGILQTAGLGDPVRKLSAVPLAQLLLASRRHFAGIPLSGSVALSRETLDAALVEEAVRAGVAFLPETVAALGGIIGSARTVQLRQTHQQGEAVVRLVLAADGLGGKLLAAVPGWAQRPPADSWIGAGAVVDDPPGSLAPGTVYMACGHGGYVGMARIEDGRLDVAAALDPRRVRACGHPGTLAAAIVEEAGLPMPPRLPALTWRGTVPLTRPPSRVAFERVLVVGDAAGYVEPFTGEGIAWALTTAKAVVPFCLGDVSRWRPGQEQAWTACYRRTMARRQRFCQAVVRVLRYPRLTTAIIVLLARMPFLAAPVVRSFNQ